MKTGSYKGRIYGLPFSADSSVLIWNKKLFKQAGLDPEKGPTNWAEIEAAAEKVNALGGDIKGFYFSGNCGGCNIFTFTPLIWASGGDILTEDGSKATLDSPQLRGAIDLLPVDGQEGPGAGGRADRHRLQLLRRLRHRQYRHHPVRRLRHRRAEHAVSRTSTTASPSCRARTAAGPPSPAATISSSPRARTKIAVVKEFLDFAYSLEGQTMLAKYGSLPVRGDIAKEALKDLDPRYQIAAEAMAKGRTPYTVVFNDLINSANGPWTQMVNEVFFGDDVDGSIANAQETMQSIIDRREQ